MHCLAADHLDDPQQNDGAEQRYQHGRNGDGIIDRPDTQQRADEVTGQECADNSLRRYRVSALLRIGMHDSAGNVANDRTGNEVYDEVHFLFSYYECFKLHGLPCVLLIHTSSTKRV